jgi:hypothetical protein
MGKVCPEGWERLVFLPQFVVFLFSFLSFGFLAFAVGLLQDLKDLLDG